mgnify:CR=1 FL=1
MAKAELGTKRTCPDTGKKFYDLNKDPIVSPYTNKSWPLSYFEETSVAAIMEKAEEEEVAEVDTENTDVELVSLEDADEASGDDIPDIGDDDVEALGHVQAVAGAWRSRKSAMALRKPGWTIWCADQVCTGS